MLKQISSFFMLFALFLTTADLNAGKKRKRDKREPKREILKRIIKNKKRKIDSDDDTVEVINNDDGEIVEHNDGIIIDDDSNTLNNNNNNNNNNIFDTNNLDDLIAQANDKLNSVVRYEFDDVRKTVIEFDSTQGIKFSTQEIKDRDFQKEDPISRDDFEIGQQVLVLHCGHSLCLDEEAVDTLLQKLKRTVRSVETEYPCPSCRALINHSNPGNVITLGSAVEFMRFLVFNVPQHLFDDVYRACKGQGVPENWNALIDRFYRTPATQDIARVLLKCEKNLTQDYVDSKGNRVTLLSFFMQQQEDCCDEVNFLLNYYSREDLLEVKDNSPLSIALQSRNSKYLEMIFSSIQPSSNEILALLTQSLNKQSLSIQNKNILFLISQLIELDDQDRDMLFNIFVSYVSKINRRADHNDLMTLMIDKIGQQNLYNSLIKLNNAILLNNVISALFYVPECKDLALQLINSDQCKPYLNYSTKIFKKTSINLLREAIMTDSSWAVAPILNKCGDPRTEVLVSTDNPAGCSICDFAIKFRKNECLKAILDCSNLLQDDYINLLKSSCKIQSNFLSEDIEVLSLIISKLKRINNEQKIRLFEAVAQRARGYLCSSVGEINLIENESVLIEAVLKKVGRLDLLKFDNNKYGNEFNAFKYLFPAYDNNKESQIIHPKILKLFLQYRLPVTNGFQSCDNALISFLDYYRFTSYHYVQDFLECIELLIDYGANPEKKVVLNPQHLRFSTDHFEYIIADIFSWFTNNDKLSLWNIKDPLKAQIYSTLKQHKKRKPDYCDSNIFNIAPAGAQGGNAYPVNNNNNNNNNNCIGDDTFDNQNNDDKKPSWCVIS